MLVAAYRDVLRVVSAQEGCDYEDDLGIIIEDADDHPPKLKVVFPG